MNCPFEVARTLWQILEFGIIYSRSAGWLNDAKLAAVEADHVHNLPRLLGNYDERNLRYYWRVERACYLRQRDKLGLPLLTSFNPLWGELLKAAPFLDEEETLLHP